jgi:phage terminase small subunit
MGKHMPQGLSAEARRLFRETMVQNALDVIDDAASMTLLENACRALDRLRAAEAVIAKEGPTIVDRFQQVKPHPMTARIDAEGQTIRQSLAAITNHQAAAAYRRGLGTGATAGESDPWGMRQAREEPI